MSAGEDLEHVEILDHQNGDCGSVKKCAVCRGMVALPRTPEGTINNCALANGAREAECQVCRGTCPDRLPCGCLGLWDDHRCSADEDPITPKERLPRGAGASAHVGKLALNSAYGKETVEQLVGRLSRESEHLRAQVKELQGRMSEMVVERQEQRFAAEEREKRVALILAPFANAYRSLSVRDREHPLREISESGIGLRVYHLRDAGWASGHQLPLPPPPKTLAEQVQAFHRRYGHPVRPRPTVPEGAEVRFRLRLVTEEFFELLDACGLEGCGYHESAGAGEDYSPHEMLLEDIGEGGLKVDLPAVADALGDLFYVLEGTAACLGIDMVPVLAGWKPPDVAAVLHRQGWEDGAP